MRTNRMLFVTVVLASFATACTAIVLGQVGEFSDYKTSDTPAGQAPTCSLLKSDQYGTKDVTPNTCSSCIETNCQPELDYACQGDKQKAWFADIKKCAQNPWVSGFGPADASSSSNSYGCFPFEKDKEVPSGDTTSDTYFEATAHNCVTDKCFQNDPPSCKKCEVHIKRSDNDDVEARLEDDPCGMCVAQFCQPVLTKCCDVVDTMMSLVKKCAYTALAENKAACYELRKNDLDGGYPDAGRGQGTPINESYQEQVDCFQEITNCYKNNCAGQTACKAP